MNNIIYLVTAMPLSLILVMVIRVGISLHQGILNKYHRQANYFASFFMTFILLLSTTSTYLGAETEKESIRKESTSDKNPKTETEKSKQSDAEPTHEERTKPNDPPKINMFIRSNE